MNSHTKLEAFAQLNTGYARAFQPGQLTLGLVAPLEAYPVGGAPHMTDHLNHIQLADDLGFAAIWLRDIPFTVPSFGDVGQMHDPFVYSGALAVATRQIGIGIGSAILPLRHPAHVAKSAASADVLSGGRLLLGVASGDRPDEYPAMALPYADRGDRFRDAFDYIRAMGNDRPVQMSAYGTTQGDLDMLPKPTGAQLPMLVTGGSRQDPDWIAAHSDGWITYPRDPRSQARAVADYRHRVLALGHGSKPVMQSLYIDLLDADDAAPSPIHLGFQSGIGFLKDHLDVLRDLGINHVALNLRFNAAPIPDTLQRLADALFPNFSNPKG